MWRETSILFALQDPCGIKWDKGWVRSFRTHVYWPDSGNHSVLFPVSEGSPVRNTASSSLAKCHRTRTTEMSCDKEQLVCMAEERLCPENHLNRRKRNLEKKNLKNSVVFLRQGQAGEPLGYFVALENYYKAWKWEPGGGKERKATKDEQSEKRGTKSQIQRKQA